VLKDMLSTVLERLYTLNQRSNPKFARTSGPDPEELPEDVMEGILTDSALARVQGTTGAPRTRIPEPS